MPKATTKKKTARIQLSAAAFKATAADAVAFNLPHQSYLAECVMRGLKPARDSRAGLPKMEEA